MLMTSMQDLFGGACGIIIGLVLYAAVGVDTWNSTLYLLYVAGGAVHHAYQIRKVMDRVRLRPGPEIDPVPVPDLEANIEN